MLALSYRCVAAAALLATLGLAGCTEKEDLLPIVSLQGGKAVITLRRIDEDKCRQDLEQGVELKWSFQELGLTPGAPVSVNNPYQLPRS